MPTVLSYFGSFQPRCIVQRDFMAKFIYIEIQYVLKCMHRFFRVVKQNVGYIYYLHDNRNDSSSMVLFLFSWASLCFKPQTRDKKNSLSNKNARKINFENDY